MDAPDSICQLVEKFDRDKPGSEDEVQQYFVDPLFEALGWNMRDKRQVRHEPSVIVREAGLERSKRADYSFHIGSARHFFVETKMPHINLERNAVPAFQLRRYGYSGNTPVSVLTDFEEFCAYDCRVRPNQNDPASKARLDYWTYETYIDNWDEIESRFHREAVAQGALREWVEGERVRGASSVDKDFLREMEKWRELLAKDIALHNRDLSQRQLNLLVQRTIDRIVFLRIAEDREIEAYGRLRSAGGEGKQVYEELKQLFISADDKYNSGLFHFGADDRASAPDSDSLNIHIPDEPLRHIIKNLYFPDSPFEFSVMPPEILGQVYEQFLGKVIELSAGGAARVEEKPEVRKAGGVYYTPAYIVDYIVENTVGALLKDRSPAQAAKLRILDPACGSGSFLVGAYQYLLDWHLDAYSREPDKHKNVLRRIVGGYVLATAEKRRILRNNIYGVDLDQNAVEVSKLSLLLKMLENESDAAGRQTLMFAAGGRILPDLSDNIKWGNSLIGSDFFRGPQATLFDDEEEMLKVKAFDWDSDAGFGAVMAAGGFDAVIGNPPYVDVKILGDDIKDALSERYRAATKRFDLYIPFVEKALSLINKDGFVAFIMPSMFMRREYGDDLRKEIIRNGSIVEIVDFGTNQVFHKAMNYVGIFTLNNSGIQKRVRVLRFDRTGLKGAQIQKALLGAEICGVKDIVVPETVFHEEREWLLQDISEAGISSRLFDSNTTFENILEFASEGIHSGKDGVHYLSSEKATELKLETPPVYPLAKGKDIHRYENVNPQTLEQRVIYPYDIESGEVFAPKHYRATAPRTWQYLESQRHVLSGRGYFERSSKRWYELWNQRNPVLFTTPKIVGPEIAVRGEFTLCRQPLFVNNKIKVLIPKSDVMEKLEYILGLINSNLLIYLYRMIAPPKGNNYFEVKTRVLYKLPFRVINFGDSADVALHDKMVELVDEMLDLHKQLPGLTGEGRRITEALIETVDSEIDALVYTLYGLSDDEVAIVEGGEV